MRTYFPRVRQVTVKAPVIGSTPTGPASSSRRSRACAPPSKTRDDGAHRQRLSCASGGGVSVPCAPVPVVSGRTRVLGAVVPAARRLKLPLHVGIGPTGVDQVARTRRAPLAQGIGEHPGACLLPLYAVEPGWPLAKPEPLLRATTCRRQRRGAAEQQPGESATAMTFTSKMWRSWSRVRSATCLERDPGGWTGHRVGESGDAARAVASSSAGRRRRARQEGGRRRPVRPPLTCGPGRTLPVTPEVLGDRATDAAAAAGDQARVAGS